MSLKTEYLQSLYQTEQIIKQNKAVTVEIVKNRQTGELAVKKTLTDKSLGEVYHILKNFDHINIVKVIDVFELEKSLVVIEEYIQGKNLSEYLKVPMEEKVVINWIKQICSALDFLHNQEPAIIHRDLKPSNIMVQRGQIILIDFDIARSVKHDSIKDTRLLGTSGYAPPEQYGFAQTDTRSDIYSLGIIFRECLQGKTRKWDAITSKCTAIDPKNRYQTVKEVMTTITYQERQIGKFASIIVAIMMILGVGYFALSQTILTHTTKEQKAIINTATLEPVASGSSSGSTTSVLTESFVPNKKELIKKEREISADKSAYPNIVSRAELLDTSEVSNEMGKITIPSASINKPSNNLEAALLKAHNVLYPQFGTLLNINDELSNILYAVRTKQILPQEANIYIVKLVYKVRSMSEQIDSIIIMDSQPALADIAIKWSGILYAYEVIVDSKFRPAIASGNYDQAETVLTNIVSQYNERVSLMRDKYDEILRNNNINIPK